MQNEITGPMELLDRSGHIVSEGWARRPFWRYERGKVKDEPLRIKEWDYYSVLSREGRFGITMTMILFQK